MTRPTWNDYFIGLAYYTSLRSSDSETKVGCVVVNDVNRVLSMGYNGFCMDVEDSELPTTRPDKYPYIVHAEENAISNMIIKPSEYLRAYITHTPCFRCAKLLWQNGIREWYIPESRKAYSHSEDDNIVYQHLLENGLKIYNIVPNLSHIKLIT